MFIIVGFQPRLHLPCYNGNLDLDNICQLHADVQKTLRRVPPTTNSHVVGSVPGYGFNRMIYGKSQGPSGCDVPVRSQVCSSQWWHQFGNQFVFSLPTLPVLRVSFWSNSFVYIFLCLLAFFQADLINHPHRPREGSISETLQ